MVALLGGPGGGPVVGGRGLRVGGGRRRGIALVVLLVFGVLGGGRGARGGALLELLRGFLDVELVLLGQGADKHDSVPFVDLDQGPGAEQLLLRGT